MVLTQLIKSIGSLLQITPYAKMNKGLASNLVNYLMTLLVS